MSEPHFRVAMVGACPFPAPQGSQVLLRTTAEALHARGHDVRLVVYAHGAGEYVGPCPVCRARGLPGANRIAAGPYPLKPLLDLMLLAALRRVNRAFQPHVVHAHNYEALIAALMAGRRPVVYHAHNAMADELPHFWKRGRALGRWLDTTFPRRADHVIALHERLRDYLIECGCAPDKVSVVPPPMMDAFPEPRYGSDLPPIVYAGNVDAYQNLDLLMRALVRVRAVQPSARLIMATVPPFNSLKGVPNLETVDVSNFDTLRQTLASDCVIACPRISWSGYPIKNVNAMAAGRPVVACRGAAYPVKDGETGLVAPDNDEQAFADALLRLMQDATLRQTLGQNARNFIQSQMSAETIGGKIEEIYRRIAHCESE